MNSLASVMAFGSLFMVGNISFLSAKWCTMFLVIPPSDSTPDIRIVNGIGSRFRL
jgi:hypothetical protein